MSHPPSNITSLGYINKFRVAEGYDWLEDYCCDRDENKPKPHKNSCKIKPGVYKRRSVFGLDFLVVMKKNKCVCIRKVRILSLRNPLVRSENIPVKNVRKINNSTISFNGKKYKIVSDSKLKNGQNSILSLRNKPGEPNCGNTNFMSYFNLTTGKKDTITFYKNFWYDINGGDTRQKTSVSLSGGWPKIGVYGGYSSTDNTGWIYLTSSRVLIKVCCSGIDQYCCPFIENGNYRGLDAISNLAGLSWLAKVRVETNCPPIQNPVNCDNSNDSHVWWPKEEGDGTVGLRFSLPGDVTAEDLGKFSSTALAMYNTGSFTSDLPISQSEWEQMTSEFKSYLESQLASVTDSTIVHIFDCLLAAPVVYISWIFSMLIGGIIHAATSGKKDNPNITLRFALKEDGKTARFAGVTEQKVVDECNQEVWSYSKAWSMIDYPDNFVTLKLSDNCKEEFQLLFAGCDTPLSFGRIADGNVPTPENPCYRGNLEWSGPFNQKIQEVLDELTYKYPLLVELNSKDTSNNDGDYECGQGYSLSMIGCNWLYQLFNEENIDLEDFDKIKYDQLVGNIQSHSIWSLLEKLVEEILEVSSCELTPMDILAWYLWLFISSTLDNCDRRGLYYLQQKVGCDKDTDCGYLHGLTVFKDEPVWQFIFHFLMVGANNGTLKFDNSDMEITFHPLVISGCESLKLKFTTYEKPLLLNEGCYLGTGALSYFCVSDWLGHINVKQSTDLLGVCGNNNTGNGDTEGLAYLVNWKFLWEGSQIEDPVGFILANSTKANEFATSGGGVDFSALIQDVASFTQVIQDLVTVFEDILSGFDHIPWLKDFFCDGVGLTDWIMWWVWMMMVTAINLTFTVLGNDQVYLKYCSNGQTENGMSVYIWNGFWCDNCGPVLKVILTSLNLIWRSFPTFLGASKMRIANPSSNGQEDTSNFEFAFNAELFGCSAQYPCELELYDGTDITSPTADIEYFGGWGSLDIGAPPIWISDPPEGVSLECGDIFYVTCIAPPTGNWPSANVLCPYQPFEDMEQTFIADGWEKPTQSLLQAGNFNSGSFWTDLVQRVRDYLKQFSACMEEAVSEPAWIAMLFGLYLQNVALAPFKKYVGLTYQMRGKSSPTGHLVGLQVLEVKNNKWVPSTDWPSAVFSFIDNMAFLPAMMFASLLTINNIENAADGVKSFKISSQFIETSCEYGGFSYSNVECIEHVQIEIQTADESNLSTCSTYLFEANPIVDFNLIQDDDDETSSLFKRYSYNWTIDNQNAQIVNGSENKKVVEISTGIVLGSFVITCEVTDRICNVSQHNTKKCIINEALDLKIESAHPENDEIVSGVEVEFQVVFDGVVSAEQLSSATNVWTFGEEEIVFGTPITDTESGITLTPVGQEYLPKLAKATFKFSGNGNIPLIKYTTDVCSNDLTRDFTQLTLVNPVAAGTISITVNDGSSLKYLKIKGGTIFNPNRYNLELGDDSSKNIWKMDENDDTKSFSYSGKKNSKLSFQQGNTLICREYDNKTVLNFNTYRTGIVKKPPKVFVPSGSYKPPENGVYCRKYWAKYYVQNQATEFTFESLSSSNGASSTGKIYTFGKNGNKYYLAVDDSSNDVVVVKEGDDSFLKEWTYTAPDN